MLTTPLTSRWTNFRFIEKQYKYWSSEKRFNIVPCGRRSGKTEIAKRRLVRAALYPPRNIIHPWLVVSAPTHDQVRRIYWDDVFELIPVFMIDNVIKSPPSIKLINGATIGFMGMDKPERIEGKSLWWWLGDEFGNMKPSVWDHVRPALADTIGHADIIGTPEGRNHYYEMWIDSIGDPEWDHHQWDSSIVLPEKEILSLQRQLDPDVYKQEILGKFISFTGRAYYCFSIEKNVIEGLRDRVYDPKKDLIFTFDFNVEPGTAAIIQENDELETCIIGEVYIPKDSNTHKVVDKLIHDWGDHEGYILCYGDATGGARKTSSRGTDWDIISSKLTQHFDYKKVSMRNRKSNPTERSRINCINSRCKSANNQNHLYVDSKWCPKVIQDFEGVRLLQGGSGEINKRLDPKLSHLSDGIGYYISEQFPIIGGGGLL